jgi:hypothetical protein
VKYDLFTLKLLKSLIVNLNYYGRFYRLKNAIPNNEMAFLYSNPYEGCYGQDRINLSSQVLSEERIQNADHEAFPLLFLQNELQICLYYPSELS